MSDEMLVAPFPWFGGKRRVAQLVWQRFGQVRNYIEPFFGSGAVLLGRPQPFDGVETVNDLDGFVANFWRAVQADPEAVAHHADWPANENDLHARHIWLVERRDKLQTRLEGDAEFFDARIAGYWVWGMALWIGGEFCSGNGPWQSVDVDGVRELVNVGNAGQGVERRRLHLSNAGQGVKRQTLHLGTSGQDVKRQKLRSTIDDKKTIEGLINYLSDLSSRFRRVRVSCGDWSRVCTPSITTHHGITAMLFDPPYSDDAQRHSRIYTRDDLSVAHDVRRWCIENGNDPSLRIALCGYEGEHQMPSTWSCVAWKAHGGYAARNVDNMNSHRERIWFSPHCLQPDDAQPMLWEERDER